MHRNIPSGVSSGIARAALLLGVATCLPARGGVAQSGRRTPAVWPAVERQTRPWTRWWWMGSAVDSSNIQRLLRLYAQAGIGGVEITPIYGAVGFEPRYIDFLSPRWVEMLRLTVRTAGALGMGVDMNAGTGWPFGGPQITPTYAAADLVITTDSLPGGRKTYHATGQPTGQEVNRAAPGGTGLVMDHFSKAALDVYLRRFDRAFQGRSPGVRAYFNDSYEVQSATWTPDLFDEFARRRGYDLRQYLYALAGDASTDTMSRVKLDYRETMSDLLLEHFALPWTAWAHRYHGVTRYQAHGSPGNLLDLYGAADIPETEAFGPSTVFPRYVSGGTAGDPAVNPDPMFLRFASSAAHVNGKPLASSETLTWISEHFQTSLADMKPELEQLFLSGINHVVFHGTTYSPADAPFPGWLFYASVEMVPSNSIWPHLSGLTDYITRCQSVLQAGKPDNELLVYWPVYDLWSDASELEYRFSVDPGSWLRPTAFYRLGLQLQQTGYAFDFASDRVLSRSTARPGALRTAPAASPYKALVVPQSRLMPVETLRQIVRLAHGGAKVVMQQFPEDVPGLHDLESRRRQLRDILARLSCVEDDGVKRCNVGAGQLLVSADVPKALALLGIPGERLTDRGLQFIRRNVGGGKYYYLVNHTPRTVDAEIPLNIRAATVVIMDPESGAYGQAPVSRGPGTTSVRVQLRSGEAIVLKAAKAATPGGARVPPWKYLDRGGTPVEIDGPWSVRFTAGGPVLPSPRTLRQLVSWTELADTTAVAFSGSAEYTTTFDLPDTHASEYVLDLGTVYESARVWINGHEVGVLWSDPFLARVGRYLRPGRNTIRIEVANLLANRIRDMDRKRIPWRTFHNINFVNIQYGEFDASRWEPRPSGLLGPVLLIPYP